MKRRQGTTDAGRWFIYGLRRGEWWIGVRDNFEVDAWEFCVLGLTLMVGKR